MTINKKSASIPLVALRHSFDFGKTLQMLPSLPRLLDHRTEIDHETCIRINLTLTTCSSTTK